MLPASGHACTSACVCVRAGVCVHIMRVHAYNACACVWMDACGCMMYVHGWVWVFECVQ